MWGLNTAEVNKKGFKREELDDIMYSNTNEFVAQHHPDYLSRFYAFS